MANSAGRSRWSWWAAGLAGLAGLVAAVAAARAEDLPAPAALPPPLTLCDAIRTALAQNPQIVAARQDHGIGVAGVMVARAYPFNPLWEGRFRYAWPVFEGATNQEPVESTVTLELEVRGQKMYRTAAATASLSRTDWQIADQELTLAVRVVRAFDTVVYRFQKQKLILDTIALDEKTLKDAQGLVEAKKLQKIDEIILRTEVEDAKSQLGLGRTALATASSDLKAALGIVGGSLVLKGDLAAPPLPMEPPDALADAARRLRPDRHAQEAAVVETDARLRLERANRFGNPTIGPTYEYDNGSLHNLGVQFSLPLPVLNAHRSDILQRQAEKVRAQLDLRAIDVQIGQDVDAALARLKEARAWADSYKNDVLPSLENSLKEVRQLFDSGDTSVDALKILDVQRKVLVARNGYLDSQFEVRQAVADLAAALGDPSVATGPCPATCP